MRVLVVDDEADVANLVKMGIAYLRPEYQIVESHSGADALERAAREPWDLVILDLTMPEVDGYTVLAALRGGGSDVPIIVLTARDAEQDRVRGLELGADDYVTKPFNGPELLARLRAALRRASADEHAGPTIRVGTLEIDGAAFRATDGGRVLDLSATEFRLLLELARHPDRVLTRETLLERVWGYDYLGDSRLVDMAINRLRTKLGDDPKEPRYITTVRGVGYRFARS